MIRVIRGWLIRVKEVYLGARVIVSAVKEALEYTSNT